MASIEEIKAGVARFSSETSQQAATIRGIADQLEQTTALLRSLTQGTSHSRVGEALSRMEQAKQKLHEATTLAQGAVEATNSYAASF
jgi:uncharacterized protein YukE